MVIFQLFIRQLRRQVRADGKDLDRFLHGDQLPVILPHLVQMPVQLLVVRIFTKGSYSRNNMTRRFIEKWHLSPPKRQCGPPFLPITSMVYLPAAQFTAKLTARQLFLSELHNQ